ncbi:phosphatase PAP2 family protein [Erythrobacter sp. KY5]|uniref:phosphatase PAP2 family protein n=1 Tax=Erythrobacter sp. KY5 TaxID=2011159 RepID=UPI0013A6E950|nr:phosphatase PAP2 family protein [Erythrobacter sp. KY5]
MKIRGISIGYLTVVAVALIALLAPVPDNNRGNAFINLVLLLTPVFAIFFLLRPVIARNPNPVSQLASDFREHWHKVVWAGALYLSLAMSLEVFSGIKKSIPFVMPFYLDPFLVELDRKLFFGTDPWRITHALFGWATGQIVWLYNAWHMVHIGLAVWVAFSFNEAQKIRFALVLQFTWLFLGGGLAMLMASVGPVMVGDFFGDRSFDPMLAVLSDQAPSVIMVKDTLIDTMDNPLLISGISAMPSIHVAISVAAALWLQQQGSRVLTVIGWAYAAVIYIGSIHLGWHYATDGMVSAPLVILVWWLAGKYVDWLQGREYAIALPAPVAEKEPG